MLRGAMRMEPRVKGELARGRHVLALLCRHSAGQPRQLPQKRLCITNPLPSKGSAAGSRARTATGGPVVCEPALPMFFTGTPGPHCRMPASMACCVTSHSFHARSLTPPTWNMRDVSPW